MLKSTSIVIVGGCGHVGLPFGTVLADRGYDVKLLDIDINAINSVNAGMPPFFENGLEQLLKKNLRNNKIRATIDSNVIRNSDVVIFVTGTPLDSTFNPDLESVVKVILSLKQKFSKNQHIILRSTVYPGTTKVVINELSEVTSNVYYCPERIAEGFAVNELQNLPQIIGVQENQKTDLVKEIFATLGVETLITSIINAEFVKLLTNTWRYIKFAVTNEMWALITESGLDFREIRRLMTHDYPRANDFPMSGFVGGPCLIKDSRQTSHFFQNRLQFANLAYQINNGLPMTLVKHIESKIKLEDKVVGILGMAFKKDSDDARSSLAYELKSYLRPKCKEILVSDPFVKDDKSLISQDDLLRRADIIIIGAPHSIYSNIETNKPLFNVW